MKILEKIIYNIPNFNLYVFFKNSMMIILTLIPINYYLLKNNKKIIVTIFNIIPILSIINNIYYMLPMKFAFLQNLKIINTSNHIYLIYWMIYIIMLIKTINYIIKNTKLKQFIYLMLMISFSSVIVMLILPTWGDRITLFLVLTLTIIGVVLIDHIIKYYDKATKLIKIATAITCLYFISISFSIYRINTFRENYIKQQINNNNNKIIVIRNPFMYIWNNNPDGKYFIETYKLYMNIPESSEIEIYQLPYKEYIKIILGVKK